MKYVDIITKDGCSSLDLERIFYNGVKLWEAFRLLVLQACLGASKTQVLPSIKDMGYLCIDNIPQILIPKLEIEICRQGWRERTNFV